jgi:hypothetical protein
MSSELKACEEPATNGLKSCGDVMGKDMSTPPMMTSSSTSGKGEFVGLPSVGEKISSPSVKEPSYPLLFLPSNGEVAVVEKEGELLSQEKVFSADVGPSETEEGAETT